MMMVKQSSLIFSLITLFHILVKVSLSMLSVTSARNTMTEVIEYVI